MDVIPAIDLLDGGAVRLRQGDYSRKVAEVADPEPAVRAWSERGIRWLHLVDLGGARAGEPAHLDVAARLAAAAHGSPGVRVELGGGIRSVADAERVLEGAGIDVALLGTAAIRDPALVRDIDRRFPGRAAVSLDLRDGRLATDGWLATAEGDPVEVARALIEHGAAHIVVTDVARDGTKAGPNLALLGRMRAAVPDTRLVAAGGIATADDLQRLAGLGMDGAVVGLALLDESLDLAEALAAARGAA